MNDVFHSVSMVMNVDQAEIAKIVHDYLERCIASDYDRLNCPKPPIYIGPVKIKTLKERLEEATMHADCEDCIKNRICTRDVPKPCKYRYTDKEHTADRASDRYGAVLSGTFLPKTYKKEDNEMKKATITQKIKNVKDIILSIDDDIAVMESKLTIIATTDDDIFEFVLEGPDIRQSCKRSGILTGWEKDGIIRKLEKDNKELKEEYEKGLKEKDDIIYGLRWQLQLAENDKRNYEKKIKELNHENKDYEDKLLEYISKKDGLLEVNKKLQVENEKLNEENKKLKEKNFCVTSRINAYKNTNGKLQDEVLELKYQLGDIQATKEVVVHKLNTREGILVQAKKCVCGQREQDYGTPESNFQLIADLWNGYLGFMDHPQDQIQAKDVAMMMALLKIARIRNGGGSGDSFVDLAGYAACGGEIWASNKVTNGGTDNGGKEQVPKGE